MQSENDMIIDMLSIFLEEWKHRDSIMWEQVFRFYLATLTVSVLPYTNIINTEGLFSKFFFHCVGIVLSVCFLYISIAYGYRLKAASETYKNMLAKIPNNEIKRTEIGELKGSKIVLKIAQERIVDVLPIILFISLILVNVVFLIVE